MNISVISQWIDDSYPPYLEEETWIRRRCGKVAAEAGEVIDALDGYFGENPRKGVTHTMDDLIEELLDTAVAALGAVEHLTGNDGQSFDLLHAKILKVLTRAGLA